MIPLLSVGVVLTALLAAPHLLPRAALSPTAGICLWSSVLWLRAVLCVVVVLVCVLYLPSTAPFEAIRGWCLHAVVPFVAHLGMSGHSLGDVASLLPALALATMAAAAAFGSWRAAHHVASWLRVSRVGKGPFESVIVGAEEVIVATAGFRRPEVIVSAGALLHLDDGELAAGLEHEWGHVRRGHRFTTVLAVAMLGGSRLLPLGRSAFRSLHFHLERDADEYAIRRTNDPLALASAICKVAASAGPGSAPVAFASLAGADATERLKRLIDIPGGLDSPNSSALGFALSIVILIVSGALLVTIPGLAQATYVQAHVSLGHLTGCLG